MTLLVLLLACTTVDDLKDKVEGLTNPLVVEALLLGVEPPDPGDGLDLSAGPYAAGSSLKVFLADAADPEGLEEAPVAGQSVELRSAASGGTVALVDQGDGSYTANQREQGLVYAVEEVALQTTVDERDRRIGLQAPPAAELDLALTHPRGEPLTIDIEGQDFDGLLVVLLGGGGAEPTYSNMPQDIRELYDFTHGGGALSVEIPGEALAESGLFALGVAGTRNADGEGMEEVNTALSSFIAGKLRFFPLLVEG